ncbi:MAG: DUF4190 domain-containing protein [Phycisphaerae bacterium]
MTEMSPPPDAPNPVDGLYPTRQAQVPMSTACVAAFICSLLLCIPFLTQLVGLILGIVGIGYTSGQKARGRGLAIAAVVISPFGALAWCALALVWMQTILPMSGMGQQLERLWNDETLAEATTFLYEDILSERLKVRVDQPALQAYARQVIARYGKIQSMNPADEFTTQRFDDDGWVLNFQGRFEQGPADIAIDVGLDGLKPQIDNITVGELVLAPEQ